MVNHKRKYYRAALEKEVIFIIIPSVAPAVCCHYNSKPNLNPKLQLMSSAFRTFKS